MEKLMSLQQYVRQVRPRNESYIPPVDKIQNLLESSTKAAKEMEYLLVHVAGGRIPPAKKKFTNIKPYSKKNGFESPEDLGVYVVTELKRLGSILFNQSVMRLEETTSFHM